MGGILVWIIYFNKPTEEELEAQEKAKAEQLQEEKAAVENQVNTTTLEEQALPASDSLRAIALQNKLGSFAYSGSLPSAKDGATTTVSNDLMDITVSNKGGYITEVKLLQHSTYDSIPVYLIKDGNSFFNMSFSTTDNRNLNTKDLYFEPTVTNNGDNKVLSMKLKVSGNEYLEYRYELKKGDYMLDFGLRSQGLTYEYEGDKTDKLSPAGDDDEVEKDLSWMNYRQHFFSSMLLSDTPFKEAKLFSRDLLKEADDRDEKTIYTKEYKADLLLETKNGELDYAMNMYYGPTDYKIFKAYDRNLDEAMPLGWGIFGFLNKYLVIPFFGFLSGFLPAGIAIIVMTIVIKLFLSPVQYKQYTSQAKMKILKPEIAEIAAKYKDNAMKKQQETMALYSKAGASPAAGCLPALLQIPVFYALFTFFPSAFDLRGKSFLWADDLSSYDQIVKLPFEIPFYGDHVSLFPILAAVTIFFSMRLTTGNQQMQAPTQEGMPDMSKMMKYMMYLTKFILFYIKPTYNRDYLSDQEVYYR